MFDRIKSMGISRRVEPHERELLVREQCPGYLGDDDDDFEDSLERFADQSLYTRILHRGPLTDEEKDDVVAWMIQRIRCLARIPEDRPPTEWEMYRAAIMMMCMIVVLDNPVRPDSDGAAYFDLSEIGVALDMIFITPRSGRDYIRKVGHELAQRLQINEVAQEVFYAAEVCIEAPGWDNGRERHKLSMRVENGLMVGE